MLTFNCIGLYAGLTAVELLESERIDNNISNGVRINCHKFWMCAFKQIKQRFTFGNAADITDMLFPRNAPPLANLSLSTLFKKLPILEAHVDVAEAKAQFRDQSRLKPSNFGCESITKSCNFAQAITGKWFENEFRHWIEKTSGANHLSVAFALNTL